MKSKLLFVTMLLSVSISSLRGAEVKERKEDAKTALKSAGSFFRLTDLPHDVFAEKILRDFGVVLAVPYKELQGHTGLVNAAQLSPDGSRVVTASEDGTARVWDSSSGKLISALEGHTDVVNAACFSPDGKNSDSIC